MMKLIIACLLASIACMICIPVLFLKFPVLLALGPIKGWMVGAGLSLAFYLLFAILIEKATS